MLAQLQTVDPSHLKDILLIAVAFCGVVTPLATLAVNSHRSQKREVVFGDAFMTKELCTTAHGNLIERVERCESAIRDAVAEFRKDVQQMEAKQEQRAVALHERINTLSVTLTNAVAELRGQVQRL